MFMCLSPALLPFITLLRYLIFRRRRWKLVASPHPSFSLVSPFQMFERHDIGRSVALTGLSSSSHVPLGEIKSDKKTERKEGVIASLLGWRPWRTEDFLCSP